jgi:alpha-2-macroglobulin-like protein
MVILDLPIPAGFAMAANDWDKYVAEATISKVQLTPRSAIVYLRRLDPGGSLELRYRLTATMPVKTAVAPARAYEYYNPDKQATSGPANLTVAAGR